MDLDLEPYLDVLNLLPGKIPTLEEANAAYKTLLHSGAHPDKGGSTQTFQKITQAIHMIKMNNWTTTINNNNVTTARLNNASMATFSHRNLDHPFAEGMFRWVAKGVYTEGLRKGEPCVAKWFKTGIIFEEKYYEKDVMAVDKALEILVKWNNSRFITEHIMLNKVEVWTFIPNPGIHAGKWAGSKCLQEPFITNYTKFNSNTGWNNRTLPWSKVMQAVSHFSFHQSGGQFVLCDLQGGQYSNGVILTDPVILSSSKYYGATDLGPQGISTFFSRHKCNKFCKSYWLKPRNTAAYFPEMEGTSMF